MISLITPAHGNSIALKRTIDSIAGVINDVVIADVCIFKEDSESFKTISGDYNKTIVKLPFTHIYDYGFSQTLNLLSTFAKNDVVIYLNVGEILDSPKQGILNKITPEYNCWYIDHATEKHRWWRCFNRKEMRFDGLIHEELIGNHKPYAKPILRFADTEKDMDDKFKAKVLNSVKEIVYWSQLIKIVDDPELLASTSPGWLQFAKDNYQSMKDRLEKKGRQVEAFENCDLPLFLNEVMTSPEFEQERFESNHMIEFQGSPLYLGKK